MALSQIQKRHLRGLAHALSPVVMIGQKGLTATLREEFDRALCHHELVKVKVAAADRVERARLIDDLGREAGAEPVQVIGHTASFFRRNREHPVLTLPK
jgi:RNA-binding protein